MAAQLLLPHFFFTTTTRKQWGYGIHWKFKSYFWLGIQDGWPKCCCLTFGDQSSLWGSKKWDYAIGITHSTWLSLQAQHYETANRIMGVFSSIELVWCSCKCVCVYIYIACLLGHVCIHAVWRHWFVFELAQRRAPAVFKHRHSHLGRNPHRVKSIPQRFHAALPSMLPSSQLREPTQTLVFHRRPWSRKSPRWCIQNRVAD